MARMFVDGDDLVVHLSWREKAAARRGNVRLPLTAVNRVTVEPDWWRVLRGVPHRGVWIPGARCIGTRRHQAGTDFVAIRPSRPVVCVELRTSAPFRLLAVSLPEAQARTTAQSLGASAPNIDTSTPWRQPLAVPEENTLQGRHDPFPIGRTVHQKHRSLRLRRRRLAVDRRVRGRAVTEPSGQLSDPLHCDVDREPGQACRCSVGLGAGAADRRQSRH